MIEFTVLAVYAALAERLHRPTGGTRPVTWRHRVGGGLLVAAGAGLASSDARP